MRWHGMAWHGMAKTNEEIRKIIYGEYKMFKTSAFPDVFPFP